MFNKKFLFILIVLAIVSIGIVSAYQLDNSHEDNMLLKPLSLENKSLGLDSVRSELTVTFYTNKNSIHNGDECKIVGNVDSIWVCMGGDKVHIYIDGNYVDDIELDTNTGFNGFYSEYEFHDLTSGEHNLTLIYDGYDHSGLLPDIDPCSYTCKINVISDYKINVDSKVSVNVGDSAIINGNFVKKGKPVGYASIGVYINNKFDSIIQTDYQGHFKYNFTPQSKGDYDINFRFKDSNWDSTNSSSHVKVSRDDNLTMDLSPRNMTVKSAEIGIFNGTLLNKGKPMSNASIDVYINHRFIKVIKTDSEGHFTYPFISEITGDFNVTFLHGTSEYDPIKKTSIVSVHD